MSKILDDPNSRRLRKLLFGAEQAEKQGDLATAQSLWLELFLFLTATSAKGKTEQAHTYHLQRQCQKHLVQLSHAPQTVQRESTLMAPLLPAMPDGQRPIAFGVTTSQGKDLLTRLKGKTELKALLSCKPPYKHQQALLKLPERLRPHTGSKYAFVPPPPVNRAGQAAGQGRGFSGAYAKPPIPNATAAMDMDLTGSGPGVQSERKRDARGQPKAFAADKDRWAAPKAPRLQSGRQPLRDNDQNVAGMDEDGYGDGCPPEEDPVEPDQGANEPFRTARSVLAADMRKKGRGGGRGYNPREYSSGSMFAGAPASSNVAPRAGLARPAGRLGPPSKRGGGGQGAGVRGGFVPPFVKKAANAAGGGGEDEEGVFSAKTLQMLAGPDGEMPEALQKLDPKLVEQVCNEVMDSSANVRWEDIAGQAQAKRLIQELVVWPMLNPHLFKGARAPPKGVLLFGPPGTGKTLIGKAVASNIHATFFNISASSLTSKWIGEGEKMVRALFAVAQCMQPAVIFIDEIDSILSARKSDGEHEASRRMKTELLVQMEGCDPNSAERRVLLVGATNRPEELDEAARRRMPKQLYIPLPCEEARRQMIDRQLGPGAGVKADLSESDLLKIVAKTAGYSGSDMRNLIQEACQGPVRDAVAQHASAVASLSEADLRPIVLRDFQMAAKAQRASVEPAEVARYIEYDAKHGARYVAAGSTAETMDEDDW
ncbi:hypothetical protein WJX72_005483 [[Myrmecia] bisecta]|uniref:AAA+ ATPase domain-containing protein n=1 Tax=[Myrmecia] bisecta TaxID=41462 RepID=A0AAW1QBW4_9CHLO